MPRVLSLPGLRPPRDIRSRQIRTRAGRSTSRTRHQVLSGCKAETQPYHESCGRCVSTEARCAEPVCSIERMPADKARREGLADGIGGVAVGEHMGVPAA